jgi:hypothetical protein
MECYALTAVQLKPIRTFVYRKLKSILGHAFNAHIVYESMDPTTSPCYVCQTKSARAQNRLTLTSLTNPETP